MRLFDEERVWRMVGMSMVAENYEERLCKHLLELQSGVKFRTSFCDQST